MFRDYLLEYLASSKTSEGDGGSIQLAAGFDPTQVSNFPAHPLSTLNSFAVALASAVILSAILFTASKMTKKEGDQGSGIGSLYLAVFLDSFGAMMMLPFLGILAVKFGCDGFQASCLGAIFAATQFVGTGILGVLADKYDKKLILLWTLGMCALCIFFSGLSLHLPTGNHRELVPNPKLSVEEAASCLAGTATGGKTEGGPCEVEKVIFDGGLNWAFIFLLGTRALAGFFASTVSVIQTIVAERSPDDKRTENIAMVMGYFGLGMVGGPLIGGLAYDYGIEALCYSAGAITIVNVVYAKFQLAGGSEAVAVAGSKAADIQKEEQEGKAKGETAVKDALKTLVEEPFTLALLCATFLSTGSFSLWITAGSFFCLAVYQWGGTQIGVLTTISGVMMFIAQLFIAGPATAKLGDAGAIVVGSLLRSVCMIGYLIRSPVIPWVMFPLGTISNALIDAQLQSLMTSFAPAHSLGTLLGIMQSLRSLGEAVFPPAGGYLVDVNFDISFYVSGGMAVFCAALIATGMTKSKAKKAQ